MKRSRSRVRGDELVSIDSLLTESTINSRTGNTPQVDYLAKAKQSTTVAPGPLDIGRAGQRIREIVPPEALRLPSYDPDVLVDALRRNMPEDRRNDHQYINNLLEDTQPDHLLPPPHEQSIPNGQKHDWQAINLEDSILVSQRLLKSYQSKRRDLRNSKNRKNDENVLKAEHIGYRRYIYGVLKYS